MEETNFVLLWKEHYDKIDQSLAINKQLLREVTTQKAESVLRSVARFKARGIVAVVIYLIVLGVILFYAISNYSSAANYFIISMTIILLINLKALYDYIKHLVWIKNLNYDGSITEIQQTLARIRLSIFQHSRFMFLQLPFWTTFYLSDKWFPNAVSSGYVVFQIIFTAAFAWLAFWLYKNLTIANAEKKWVKMLIGGSGGKEVTRAITFYNEVEKFKQDD